MCVRFVLGTQQYMHALTTLSEPLIYIIAFAIIFAENGIATFFFLPGDTLLFSLGILAHQGIISLEIIIVVLIIAAIIGNMVGYYLGCLLRDKHKSSRLLQKIPEKYIIKTELFYKKYGSFTVLFSRFVPIIRTLAPFLAGVSKMNYKKYFLFSVIGGILWIGVVTTIGFVFGSYFSIEHAGLLAVGLMIAASVLTPLIAFLSKRYFRKD